MLATFGISSSGLNLAVNLILLFLVVVWLALVYWTYSDARRRMADNMLILCATGASLFPFVGTIIYTILRPPEYLEDARERELEIRAAELRVRQLSEQSCPHCEFPIEKSFLRCPNCRRRLKDPCPACAKPIDPRWTLCPYCETDLRGSEPAEAERPARRVARSGQRQTRQGGQRKARSEASQGKPSPRAAKSQPRAETRRVAQSDPDQA